MTGRSSILTELQLTVSATLLYRGLKINLTRARKLKMVYTVELNCTKRGGRRKKLEKKSNGDIADRNCQHIEFRTSIQLITHIWQGRILTAQLPKGKQNLRCWNIGIDRSYVHRCFGEGKREREHDLKNGFGPITVRTRLPSLISIWLKFLFIHRSKFSTSSCLVWK